MRLKELSREQLESLAINLIWAIIGLGVLIILAAFAAAILLTR